jgi:hypothetical protein
LAKQYSYDPEVEHLARYFLADIETKYDSETIKDLSQAIQVCIETWISTYEVEVEMNSKMGGESR